MKALKRTLVLMALLSLVYVVGMALPVPTMEKIADWTGMGKVLIGAPVFIYMVRVLSATFVAIGVFLLILARDPLRYGVLVPFAGAASAWIGVACGLFGIASGISVLWFIFDAIGCTVLGILVLRFHRAAVKEAEGPSDAGAEGAA